MQHAPSFHIEAVDFVGRFQHALEDMQIAFQRRVEFRRTVKELSRLTDAELLDIGLSRWNIEDVARAAPRAV